MRRLALVLLITSLALAPAACKRKRRAKAPEETGVATVIQAADPRVAPQFLKGFYPVENGWRWTAHTFTVILKPPKNAAAKGARLVLKLAIPDAVLDKIHDTTLTAKINGLDLPPETYKTPGNKTYTRDVPPSALAGDAVPVEFTLDKFLPPGSVDQRELGVIVSSAGLEAK